MFLSCHHVTACHLIIISCHIDSQVHEKYSGPVDRRPYSWAQVVVVEVPWVLVQQNHRTLKTMRQDSTEAKKFTHSALKW